MAVEQLDDGRIVELAKIIATDIQLPTEIQSRRTQTIQTHNAVSIIASGNSNSAWISTDGFDRIAISFLNDASTTSTAHVYWSFTGTTVQGADYSAIASSTVKERTAEISVKAPYVMVSIVNGDTASHTMSAWVYLKA